MTDFLSEHGYQHFFVFDNFGNFLAEVDAAALKAIDAYLLRIEQQQSARTMYYVDVLACREQDCAICRSVIETYCMRFDGGDSN